MIEGQAPRRAAPRHRTVEAVFILACIFVVAGTASCAPPAGTESAGDEAATGVVLTPPTTPLGPVRPVLPAPPRSPTEPVRTPTRSNAVSGPTTTSVPQPEFLTGVPYFEKGDFYAPPDPLPPGEPGELIRVQFAYEMQVSNADALRVMYHSRNRNNVDRAVTGIVAIPRATAPFGGRPVVSWAHGTTGIGPSCAPSRYNGDQRLGQHYVDAGYVWVATDYDGLGPPGQRHPYLSGYTEGYNVIDIVRAARRIPTTKAGSRWVAYGHSQGGQAALFAAQLAPTWAPELSLIGSVASAPASPDQLITSLDTPGGRSFALMTAAGLPTDYPQLNPADVLTEGAMAQVPVVDSGCGKEVAVALRSLGPDDTLKPGAALTEPLRSLLAENVPGQERIAAPLLIPHGTLDKTVPVATSAALQQRLCAQGQVIERSLYEGEDHGGVVLASTDAVDAWIRDRFAGRLARSNC